MTGMCTRYKQLREERTRAQGGLALTILALVKESHGSGVGRHDLEDVVQKEIVQVYKKEEEAKN